MCPSGRPLRPAPAAGSPSIRPAFDVLDADRDGRISRDDLKAFYSGFSPAAGASEDEIAAMISAADADRSGFVEFNEFERVLGRKGRNGGIMEEVFRAMDRDGDGKVGFGDLKAYLVSAGMGVGDDDVRAMIRMGGGDEAEGVCFDALVKILAVDFAK